MASPKDISSDFSEGACQPVFQSYKRASKDNGKSYSFQSSWYAWIEYSVEHNAIFCFCCRHFSIDHGHFTVSGYNNFQYATGKKGGLEVHAKSQRHIYSAQAWKARISSKAPSVASMLSTV